MESKGTHGDVATGRNIVGASEAKTRLSELLEKVRAGAEVIITRHGAAIAKLVPVKKETSREQRARAIRRIQSLGAGLALGGLKLKELIGEGRR